MRFPRRRFLRLAAAAAALPVVPRFASAESYPTRPVRVIVPFAPAGPADVLARMIMLKLSQSLGQQFYIENQAGAGGNLGMGAGARANPDGYTITVVSTSYVVNPSLYPKIPYDPYKDFEPVTLAAVSPNVMVERQRAHRLSQGKFAHAGNGHHAASFRRDVQALARSRHRVGAFQRFGSCDPVGACRPHPDRLHRAHARRAAGQGRKAARA